MYSIVSSEGRHGEIVHYLAETDQDIVRIVDTCMPGSTVEVLGNGGDDVHTYIKSPANKWVLYKGISEFTIPKNTAEVYTFQPEKNAPCSLDGQRIDTYQSGIKIYNSGYVTGTSHNARMISSTTQNHPEKQVGHFCIIGLETPAEASSYDIYDGDENKAPSCTPDPTDDYLLVRIEALDNPEKIRVLYDSGEEFTFDFTGLILD